jgi:glutamine amidotransferase-like uncharacterized protein
MRRLRFFLAIMAIMLVLVARPSPALAASEQTRTDLQGVRVAVWNETGGMVISSEVALHAMFEWMNATVTYVTSEDVMNGALAGYDVLAMPGGQIPSFFNALGKDGTEVIRQWIADGGSYFGICGGALFIAANLWLGIYNGTYQLEVPGDYSSYNLTKMDINTACAGPDLSSEPQTVSTLYWGSSYFTPRDGFEYYSIATYHGTNHSGMIAFQYHKGNVFLSSPHPEYEEGSSRDGTTDFDNLTDPESEWDMLLHVAVWQVESSLPDALNIDILTVGLVAVGIVTVVLVVVILRKKQVLGS